MNPWMMAIAMTAAATALAQAPALVTVNGADLEVVPGPRADTEPMRDQVGRLGNSPTDLQLRHLARQGGAVPARAVPGGTVAVRHWAMSPAGWQAYRVEVGPGERIKARLRGDHEAWFVVRCLNRYGQREKGMMQNAIPSVNPEASYINPKQEKATVYFVVDSTEILKGQEPYILTFTRE